MSLADRLKSENCNYLLKALQEILIGDLDQEETNCQSTNEKIWSNNKVQNAASNKFKLRPLYPIEKSHRSKKRFYEQSKIVQQLVGRKVTQFHQKEIQKNGSSGSR